MVGLIGDMDIVTYKASDSCFFTLEDNQAVYK